MGSGNEKVNVSNDQEMAQSERKCHSKKRGGKVYVDKRCLLEIAAIRINAYSRNLKHEHSFYDLL